MLPKNKAILWLNGFLPMIRRILIGFPILLSALYGWWTTTDRNPYASLTDSLIASVNVVGSNRDRGNMLGIQPWMNPLDYSTESRFRDKIRGYLTAARERGLIVPGKTIVVLPEYLGAWLVAVDEKVSVYHAPTVQEALTTLVLSNPLSFIRARWNAPDTAQDKTKHTVFAMKGPQMAEIYTNTFTQLASQYQVTIVAGSILLPDPSVQNGKLIVGNGPLYNVSAVFHPDGRLDPQLVRKVYPIADELPFVCPTNPADVPVFDTPVGKLGVLVCADSWNSPVYKTLKQKGATLLAVPSYSAGDGVWKTIWRGYSGTKTPADARADVGRITEGQAWLAHAMAGRATPEAGIVKGLNVFLRGNLWDLGTDGTTIILNDKSGPKTAPRVNGAALTCLWL